MKVKPRLEAKEEIPTCKRLSAGQHQGRKCMECYVKQRKMRIQGEADSMYVCMYA